MSIEYVRCNIGVEGMMTTDGRIIAHGALTVPVDPIPVTTNVRGKTRVCGAARGLHRAKFGILSMELQMRDDVRGHIHMSVGDAELLGSITVHGKIRSLFIANYAGSWPRLPGNQLR